MRFNQSVNQSFNQVLSPEPTVNNYGIKTLKQYFPFTAFIKGRNYALQVNGQ